MSSPYVGEIRLVGFNFAPVGWNLCDGSLMAIADNSTLFNLIGTTYGGDGQTTFGLPDLRGRVAVHQGSHIGTSFIIGQLSGQEAVLLTTAQLPSHSHAIEAVSSAGNLTSPSLGLLAASAAGEYIATASATSSLSSLSVSQAGGGQTHDNMQPYLTMNYIISLYGIYPSQS